MLVESQIDNSKWLWINIPKTASTLVRNSIFEPDHPEDRQDHYTYIENVEMYGKYIGFTVVRDPVSRFISGLNHVFNHCYCGECEIFYDVPPTTDDVILFLQDITDLSKTITDYHNKSYYNATSDVWWEIVKSMQIRFIKNIIMRTPWDCTMWSFILPQFVYLDEMDNRDYIFKYENIQTCVNFIENKLGYKVDTSKRPRSFPYRLQNVDFQNPIIKTLLHEYYKEDYKQLNY